MNKSYAIRSILLAAALSFTPSVSSAAVLVTVAPPPLPVYDQPACPGDGYLWTPGYWAWDPDTSDYYWVPGVWVLAPRVGVVWTPGWWGFEGGAYLWHVGFWGPSVGFYGGINYGFGYFGTGFVGGFWAGNVFRYNAAVWHVNRTVVHNTYIDKTVINNRIVNNRVSFNGPGGVNAKPTSSELAAMHQQHSDPTSAQQQHELAARQDRSQHYSVNHGQPKQLALQKPKGAEEHGTAANHQGQHKNAVGHHAPTAHRLAHNSTTQHTARGIAHAHHPAHVAFQAHRRANPHVAHPARPAPKPKP